MTIRETFEEYEKNFLSPYAVHSAKTLGREFFETPCQIRSEFQRDRDRIIHSKAFRRLKHKTQVFLATSDDHYRTRLTHTLEVSQIARTAARALRLNEDLTEAIALGHDLGHTPFGHTGETALNSLCKKGFRHNEQSLRVVDVLERNGGLNLTEEVRDGILCHTGDKSPQTLEGEIVRIADRIAYINHDIDGAVRGGLIRQSDIPKEFSDILGDRHSKRIDTLLKSLISSSFEKPYIKMEDSVNKAMLGLREFMFERVYMHPYIQKEVKKYHKMVEALYEILSKDISLIPENLQAASNTSDKDVVVMDYIAGMTDRYAISTFERLYNSGQKSKVF